MTEPHLHSSGFYWVCFNVDQPWEVAFRTWENLWLRCGIDLPYSPPAEIGRHLNPLEARKDAHLISAANLARQADSQKKPNVARPIIAEGMCPACGRNLDLVVTGHYTCPVEDCPHNVKWILPWETD